VEPSAQACPDPRTRLLRFLLQRPTTSSNQGKRIVRLNGRARREDLSSGIRLSGSRPCPWPRQPVACQSARSKAVAAWGAGARGGRGGGRKGPAPTNTGRTTFVPGAVVAGAQGPSGSNRLPARAREQLASPVARNGPPGLLARSRTGAEGRQLLQAGPAAGAIAQAGIAPSRPLAARCRSSLFECPPG